MRVLHVIPAIAPRYGGPSQVVLGMSRAACQRGVDVLIATTDGDGHARLGVRLGTRIAYADVPTIFFRRQWSEAFKYSHPLSAWLSAHVAEFDVVHIHAVFSHACLAAARASRRHGVPYIVSPHGTLDPWSLHQKPLRKRLLWRFGAQRMLRQAVRVHYSTLEEQHRVEASLGLRRGVVVPHGVDEQQYVSPAFPDRFRARFGLGHDPYVLVMSRLHPKKRLGPFIEAFLQVTLPDAARNWRLVIAGHGDASYTAELQRVATTSGARGQTKVVFTGWLDGPDKLSALQGASLMALPSLQENFGVAVVEAMICNVPVLVSTHVNLSEEVAAAGAGWVVGLEGDLLAQGLARALSDADELARRGAAGRKLVLERFTWSAVVPQLLELYAAAASSIPRA